MLLAPSVQTETGLVFSGDPALNLPADPTARENALRIARETGMWTPITHVGQDPAIFWFAPIHGVARTFLQNEIRRRHPMTDDLIIELAFRLGLRRVSGVHLEGGGTLTLQLGVNEAGLPWVTVASMDQLYSIGSGNVGRELVAELGEVVFQKAMQGVSPKS
jgi:hypothetical protein